MSVTIKPVLEGSSLSRTGGVLRYYVSGLANMDPSMMWSALFAGGLPQPGNPHPTAPKVGVSDVTVSRVINPFSCYVDVTYAQNATEAGSGGAEDLGEISISGSVVAIRTELDYSGEPIEVIYNPGSDAVRPFSAMCSEGQGDRCSGAEVEQLVGLMTLRIRRKEIGHPGFKCRDYVGRLNGGQFAYNGDKEAWLCTGITGVRALSDELFTVDYEFQHTEDGWHKIAAYIEPTTGKPPHKNIGSIQLEATPPRVRLPNDGAFQDKSQNGLTIVRVQGSADFSALNLPPLDYQSS